jgi:hypothetical protein
MISIRQLLNSGMRPSQAFRYLLQHGAATSASDIVNLLYEEFEDLSSSVMPAVMNWNRGARPELAEKGLSDDRLDEILLDLMTQYIAGAEEDPLSTIERSLTKDTTKV